jgi:hypothetical protein
MSATMDTTVFQKYFEDVCASGDGVPVVEIPHKSYPVTEAWLEGLRAYGFVSVITLFPVERLNKVQLTCESYWSRSPSAKNSFDLIVAHICGKK